MILRSRGTAKYGLFLAALVAGIFVLQTGTAQANHNIINLSPDPGSGGIPSGNRNYLRNCGYDSTHTQSPAFTQWIHPAGTPSTSSVTVPSGTESVPIRFRWSSVVCFAPNNVPETRMRIDSISASRGTISGLSAGAVSQLTNGSSRGHYRTANAIPFTYNLPADIQNNTTSEPITYNITINIRNRPINRFANAHLGHNYYCVNPPRNNSNHGWNYGLCTQGGSSFTLRLTVQPAPVNQGSCSINAPGSVYPGQGFTAGFSVSNTSYGGSNTGIIWPVNSAATNRYRMEAVSSNFPGRPAIIEITGPGVQPSGFGPLLYPPGHGQPNTTSWNRAFPGAPPGEYTIQYRIWDGSTEVNRCTHIVEVVERPYHKVYGGDVFAGAAFGDPCYDTDAFIAGWNLTNFLGFELSVGSGTQLGAFALNTIQHFGSGQMRNDANPGANNVKNLSFANNDASNRYGGYLHQSNAVCADEDRYWSAATNIQPDGHTVLGNLGMTGRETVYVDGDAYINGNITYASGNRNGINNVPSFRLIVRGNIYVAPNVTELNGLFVAIPTGADDGRFYTCSNGLGAPTLTQVHPGGTCTQNRLTVYGAVIADTIKLTRSGGSTLNATRDERFDYASNTTINGDPAEVFIFTPEVWLTSDFGSDGEADSIRTLPPVL